MYVMRTIYFRQLCICTAFTLKWHASETEAIVAKTYQCLPALLQCTSSLDSLLGENLVFQPQSDKKLTRAKLIPLAKRRKLIFPLSDTSSHSPSLVRPVLFMIFCVTVVQNTDDVMLFKSVTAYTSIFGHAHRSTHFYSEVYFLFDVISQWIDLFFSHWKQYFL